MAVRSCREGGCLGATAQHRNTAAGGRQEGGRGPLGPRKGLQCELKPTERAKRETQWRRKRWLGPSPWDGTHRGEEHLIPADTRWPWGTQRPLERCSSELDWVLRLSPPPGDSHWRGAILEPGQRAQTQDGFQLQGVDHSWTQARRGCADSLVSARKCPLLTLRTISPKSHCHLAGIN